MNDRAISGKEEGARVYVRLPSGNITEAVAQGHTPEAPWVCDAGGGSPPMQSRKKMEVYWDKVVVAVGTTQENLVAILKSIPPATGVITDFFNVTTDKLNVYNDDATLFFKMNVTGTWNAASNTTNTFQLSFGNSQGNIVSSAKTQEQMRMSSNLLLTLASIRMDGLQ